MKMAPGEIALGAGEPYTWDKSVQVPLQVQQIWKEVALGIDKSQTGESNIWWMSCRKESRRRMLQASTTKLL